MELEGWNGMKFDPVGVEWFFARRGVVVASVGEGNASRVGPCQACLVCVVERLVGHGCCLRAEVYGSDQVVGDRI